MTLLVIFDDLNSGKFTLDTEVVISQNAAGMGGSQAFLDANSAYKANDLIKSIIVASANDSCVAMAEHLYGDVSSFVERMNGKAKELGLNDTYFVNCTGLSAPNQYSCARDVAIMTRELIKTPLFFTHAKVWMFDFEHPGGRVTGLTNTNKLVRFYEGCDGGKTGFTSEALSCLSATAKRGDTRLISVIIGAQSSKVRNGEISKMLNYGFANFATKQIVFKDVNLLENVQVSGGKPKAIDIAPKDDYFVLTKKGTVANFKIEHELDALKAPIQSGGIVGKLIVSIDGQGNIEIPLISKNDIQKSGYLDVVDNLIDKWN